MHFLVKSIFSLSLILSITQTQPLKIYQIDVNTGDATLIVSPTNKYILIDAADDRHNYGDTVLRFLRNLGITHLDHVLVSHYHEDHIGGMPRVIYGLSGAGSNDSILGYFYDRGDTYTTSMFINYKNAAGTKRRTVALGETLHLGAGVFMYCVARNGKVLNGDSVLPNSGENYRSIAWVLQYGRFRYFTGGDIVGYSVSGERDVETRLAPFVRNIDVFKVSHHGSAYSSNNTFLDSMRAKVGIISQGVHPVNNNHPHQAALNRLAAHNIYIYQMNDNPTGGTIPSGSGRILNTTAVLTVNPASYTINGDEYVVQGVERDGACLEILQPRDTISEGMTVSPTVRVKNFGNTIERFHIRCRIGNIYNRIQTIADLAPDDTITVTFDTTWYAMRGNYEVKCSTEVFGDLSTDNDRQTTSLVVAFYDSEIEQILNPANGSIFYLGDTINPKVIIKDNSEFSYHTTIKVYCLIRNNNTIYLDSIEQISYPGITDTLTFTPIPIVGLNEGVYSCSVWVVRNNDLVLVNDYKSVSFTIIDPNGINDGNFSAVIMQDQIYKTILIKIFNISGRLINSRSYYNMTLSQSLTQLNNLSSGVYFIHSIATPSQDNIKPIKTTRKIIILPTK